MQSLVRFALQQRVLVLVLFIGFLGAGALLFRKLNIEAYPDPTPPMVDVVTQLPGLSAEEIERYITIPIEVQMAGMPNLKVIRTISLFGLSDVKLQFTFDYSYEQALQQVLNRLAQLSPLPKTHSRRFRQRARSARFIAIDWSAHRVTATSICARCRTGFCSGASAAFPV